MYFLLIRYSSLGDVVLSTSVIKNITDNDPRASVDILTKETYAPVFNNIASVNKVFAAPEIFKRYDCVLDLDNSLRSNISRFFVRADKKLSYNKAAYSRRLFLKTGIKQDILDRDIVTRYSAPLKALGFRLSYQSPQMVLTDDEIEYARQLTGDNKYVVICPGAKWRTKQWPLENYTGLAVKIIRELGMDILLLGSMEDKELCGNIYTGAGTLKRHIKELSGQTDLRQLASVIKGSEALVSTDSGPMHIGWAVSSRVVSLFGPTVKEFGFQPRDEKIVIIEKDMKCRPCSLHGSDKCRYGDAACMRMIEVHEVFEAITALLSI